MEEKEYLEQITLLKKEKAVLLSFIEVLWDYIKIFK